MNLPLNTGVRQASLVIIGFIIILVSLLFAALAGLNSLNMLNEQLATMVAEKDAKKRLHNKLHTLLHEQLHQAQSIIEQPDEFELETAWEEFVFNAGSFYRMQDQLLSLGSTQKETTFQFPVHLNHLRCSLYQVLTLARQGQQPSALLKLLQLHNETQHFFTQLATSNNLSPIADQHPIFLVVKNAFNETRQQVMLLGLLSAAFCIAIIVLIVYRILYRETALSQALSELHEVNESLETRVAERTSTLLEACDKAMEASRIKSQFLANISHELRTPLNAVIGYSDMLLEHFEEEPLLDAEEVLELIGKINDSGQSLLELIEDILDISRLETGQINISPSIFDVHELLGNTLNKIKPLFVKRNNTLRLDYETEHSEMRTDPMRLRQVLLHLLSNANKFTEQGEIQLRVQVKNIYHQDWMILRVKDTGIGISQEDQEKLFKVFSQVDGSSTRRYGGVGLGLAICQRFSQLMGGSISVQSTPDKGSTFTVRLPMYITDDQLPQVSKATDI